MIKSNKGFTLVELIVVIAILAILAGVAIPVYNGYITKAQDAAAVTDLDAIATAAQASNATAGAISEILVTNNKNADDTIVIKAAAFSDKYGEDFKLFYPDTKSVANDGTATTAATQYTITVEMSDTLNDTSFSATAKWNGDEWVGTKAN